MLREGLFSHHSTDPFITAKADAVPIAQGFFGPCPQGYVWYVENLNYHVVTSAHTAVCEIAVSPESKLPLGTGSAGSWDRQNREWWFGAAAVDGNAAPSSALYVPEGYYVVALFSGGTLAQNDIANVSMQISYHQLNPQALMSPEDRRQVMASHQNLSPEHQLVETAVASRRAV